MTDRDKNSQLAEVVNRYSNSANTETSVQYGLDLLNAFCRTANNISRAKGFHDEYDDCLRQSDRTARLGMAIALIHTELSEAVEELRFEQLRPDSKLTQHSAFSVELADAVIRIFDLCGLTGIDLAPVVRDKIIYNASRPHKHGKTV